MSQCEGTASDRRRASGSLQIGRPAIKPIHWSRTANTTRQKCITDYWLGLRGCFGCLTVTDNSLLDGGNVTFCNIVSTHQTVVIEPAFQQPATFHRISYGNSIHVSLLESMFQLSCNYPFQTFQSKLKACHARTISCIQGRGQKFVLGI